MRTRCSGSGLQSCVAWRIESEDFPAAIASPSAVPTRAWYRPQSSAGIDSKIVLTNAAAAIDA